MARTKSKKRAELKFHSTPFSFENSTSEFVSDSEKVFYILETHNHETGITTYKLGEAGRNAGGKQTPEDCVRNRYDSYLSGSSTNKNIYNIFVVPKVKNTGEKVTDSGFRDFILKHHKLNPNEVPFGSGSGITNTEVIPGYDNSITHQEKLIQLLKAYLGLSPEWDIRELWRPRHTQEDDYLSAATGLRLHKKFLLTAYTGYGKSMVSIATVLQLLNDLKQGGIVLLTTPIVDTMNAFEKCLLKYYFSMVGRGKKVEYINGKNLRHYSIDELIEKSSKGKIFFICASVQDIRFNENKNVSFPAGELQIRGKYAHLLKHINVWVRDEYHSQYHADYTGKLFEQIKADYILDLTATAYRVIDLYNNQEQILRRTLLWALHNRHITKLPTYTIECLDNLDLPVQYQTEEYKKYGWLPSKFFTDIKNNSFVNKTAILDMFEKMYFSNYAKKLNPLSINNDTDLCEISRKVGMCVFPAGSKTNSAEDYLSNMAEMLNTTLSIRHPSKKIYFISAHTLDKERQDLSVGEYVEELSTYYENIIILTCEKFLTGTDIPALGHIVLHRSIPDISNFEQMLGRMARIHTKKDNVKLYVMCPSINVKLNMAKIARKNVDYHNDGSNIKNYLACIPITEYKQTSFSKVSLEDLLETFNEYLLKNNKYLSYRDIESISLNTANWQALEKTLKKIKKSNSVKRTLTEKTDGENHEDEKIKKSKKQKQSIVELVKEALIAISAELSFVAYSSKKWGIVDVLHEPMISTMFGEELIQCLIEELKSNNNLKELFDNFLDDKKLCFNSKTFNEIRDELCIDTKFKQKLGLVFTPEPLIDNIVNKCFENKPSLLGGEHNIYVLNALDGIWIKKIKDKNPHLQITCIEYFPYYKDHLLTEYGVNVIMYNELSLEDIMKFTNVIGNPPFQDSSSDDGRAKLWTKFVKKAFALCEEGGTVALITPDSWMAGTSTLLDGTRVSIIDEFIAGKQTNYLAFNVGEYFPGIGCTMSAFVTTNTNNTQTHETVIQPDIMKTDAFTDTLYGIKSLPKNINSVSLSIVKKCTIHPYPCLSFKRTGDAEHGIEYSAEQTEHFKYAYLNTNSNHPVKYWYKPSPSYGKRKIFWCRQGSSPAIYYDLDGEYSTMDGGRIMYIPDHIDTSVEKLKSYFESKIVKFVAYVRWSQYWDTAILNRLPLLDLNKKWTDDELYDIFGLTQEEREYIEKLND